MTLNPPSQYATDRNLLARQRLWQHQEPAFDVVGWALDLAEVAPGAQILDVGCGNGLYLAAMRQRGVEAVGCDLSPGMLRAAASHRVVAADAVALPFRDGHFDILLAPHMLYHVPDRESALREFRRILAPEGRCVVVTNGAGHLASLRTIVERTVNRPGWEWADQLAKRFSLENGGRQLAGAFDNVRCVRPDQPGRAVVTDPAVIAGYVASVGDHYEPGLSIVWDHVVSDVLDQAAHVINRDGAFIVEGDVGAFVCSM